METAEAPAAAPAGERGLNFYRPTRRVVVLLFLAPGAYEYWWYWQLFLFTRRERFPRARRFWWVLVPFYGWVVLYRQFEDTADRARREGPAFSPSTAIWLVILSQVIGNASLRVAALAGFALFVASGVLIALAGSRVQPAANAYLRAEYPDARPLSMTCGEVLAAAIGIGLFALVVLDTFVWS